MKRLQILSVLVAGCTLLVAQLQGRALAQSPDNFRFTLHHPRRPVPPQNTSPVRTQTGHLPTTATARAVAIPCPPAAQALGAACGNVAVPIDRTKPALGNIQIYFELYSHSGSGSAVSAILVNFGGPGVGTTSLRSSALELWLPNLDVHDLLLIDDRGRGNSGTIACNELQDGTAPIDQAIADCATQLAPADSRYGTGDIAEDTEAVRSALGYDKVDYYGGSYGGADVAAYATRFPQHVRSIILDAPYGTPGIDGAKFAFEQYRAHGQAHMVGVDCLRSPICSRDHPSPEAEVDALIEAVRRQPVVGDARDANGNLVHVRLDEEQLLNGVIGTTNSNFSSTGEILAAAASLQRGDAKPLLRLGAENYYSPAARVGSDPAEDSMGAQKATGCVDTIQPFDWQAPIPERMVQFSDAVSQLPADYFAPFSKQAATGLLFSIFSRDCVDWQKPSPSLPIAEPNAVYPRVPTLVLTGDMDNVVPTALARRVAALFPESVIVPVAGVGHETVWWTECVQSLVSRFFEDLQPGDLTCTKTSQIIWPAVGRFPRRAAEARPATVNPGGENQAPLSEQKVATVAVATVVDALQRSMIGAGNGVGLRGGTFHTDYGDVTWVTTLSDCAFTEDVTVNGSMSWADEGTLAADLVISGNGTGGGTLHIEGSWMAPGPVGNFTVTGTLGGKQVALLVPTA